MNPKQPLTQPDPSTLPWKRISRSPDEEWLARALRTGRPEPIADSFVAAFLLTSRSVTIKPDGIRFQIGNEDLHFWEEGTLTVRDEFLGQIRTVRYDVDDLSFVHVFDEEGRYIETISRYAAPGMLDAEAQATVLAAKKRHVRAVVEELQQLHAPDTRAAVDREIRNADRVQRIRTFPAPANTEQEGAARVVDSEEEQPRDILTDKPTNAVSSRMASPSPSASSRVDGSGLPLSADAPVTEADSLTHTIRQSRSDGHSRRSEFSVASKIATEGNRVRREHGVALSEEAARALRNKRRIQKLSAVYEDY